VLRDTYQLEIPLRQATDADGQSVYRSPPLQKPGLYSLSTGLANDKIAVNLLPDAADVRSIGDAALQAALGGIDLRLEGDAVPVQAAAVEPPKDLGWGVMLAVLALLAMECFLAMRFGHFRRM
jgi:hypothetical protein